MGWALGCCMAVVALGCAGELSGNEEDYFATVSPLPKSDGGPTTPTGGCDRVPAIFDKNCKTCHNVDGFLGGLDLISPDVRSRLVDQPSTSDNCANRKRIDSANPSQSFLLEKLTANKPQCGDPMPFGSKLSAEDLTCVTAWVNDLAAGGDGS